MRNYRELVVAASLFACGQASGDDTSASAGGSSGAIDGGSASGGSGPGGASGAAGNGGEGAGGSAGDGGASGMSGTSGTSGVGGLGGAGAGGFGGAAGSPCTAWRLIEVPSDAVTSLEAVDPNTERATRFTLDGYLSGCDELAMPRVEVDPATKTVRVAARTWTQVGVPPCPPFVKPFKRPVTVHLRSAGTWTVADDGPSASATLTMNVTAPPPTPCAPRPGGGCGMDCDCTVPDLCLSGFGYGGPFTQCSQPCEVSRDCGGRGACASPADGIAFACDVYAGECGSSAPCPDGFDCNGSCEPAFTLGNATRTECECDSDCAAPVVCVEPKSAGGKRRCEMRCLTGDEGSGAWCTGPHACGAASKDVSNLAESDAVCGFVGD